MHVGASPNLCSVSTHEFHLPGSFFKYFCHRWCVPAMSLTYQLLSLSASVCSPLCCRYSVSVYEPEMFTRCPSSHRGHHCVRVRYFVIINSPLYFVLAGRPGSCFIVSVFPDGVRVAPCLSYSSSASDLRNFQCLNFSHVLGRCLTF